MTVATVNLRRVVTLPNGRSVGLATYVASWKTIKTLAPDEQVRGWNYEARPAGEILRALRYGMQDRINQHDARTKAGWRKMADEWQRETWSAARRLNTSRYIVRWLPLWLRERFAHRLQEET